MECSRDPSTEPEWRSRDENVGVLTLFLCSLKPWDQTRRAPSMEARLRDVYEAGQGRTQERNP